MTVLLPRRSLLAAAGLALVAACTGRRPIPAATPTPTAAADPDRAALADARAAELALLADLDAWFAHVPAAAARYGWVRDEHAAHLTALGGVAPEPTAAAPPAGPAATVSSLAAFRRALAASVTALGAAAVTAVNGDTAALFASVAAAHAAQPDLAVTGAAGRRHPATPTPTSAGRGTP